MCELNGSGTWSEPKVLKTSHLFSSPDPYLYESLQGRAENRIETKSVTRGETVGPTFYRGSLRTEGVKCGNVTGEDERGPTRDTSYLIPSLIPCNESSSLD